MAEQKGLNGMVKEVLETGVSVTLKSEHLEEFYQGFYLEVSEKIEKIRDGQRRAYEEVKNLVLA
jgi:hypothetical protein